MKSREAVIAGIREAAIAEFSAHGFRGTTTQAIAERAGLTKSQLHYYIGSKDALYQELLTHVVGGWSHDFARDAARGPAPVLSAYLRAKLDYALDQPELSRIFTNEILSGAPHLDSYWPAARRAIAKKIKIIDGWIAQGLMRPLDARLLLMHIWALTQHYADYAVQVRVMLGLGAAKPIDREPIVRELTELVLRGCAVQTV